MSRENRSYEMKDYARQSNFASFLPGIAGVRGIPVWCYYVNRGQGVVSFGTDNKDHAIMEFYPAHVAYQNAKRMGFRTFLRRDGAYAEGFADESNPHTMKIGMNGLSVEEDLKSAGLRLEISYFTLPEEPLGALVRRVRVTNTSDASCSLEILDGMPQIIPFGVGAHDMKNMTQTAKAWMQVEDRASGVPYYRVRASMEDSASVSAVWGGNFAFAVTESGERLSVTADPEAVFAWDNSLLTPVRFAEGGLDAVEAQEEISSNLLPCCLFHRRVCLAPGVSDVFYEMIGQAESKEILHRFLAAGHDGAWFEQKQERADALVRELTDCIDTETAEETFDAYCRYTYMDNVLRGGCPIRLGSSKIFYVYSRKHGDLERDYNYFSMLPEFYSQGNGNFRDVNQNRRMDTFFSPFVERENLHTFYSLIQPDGYNPLGVEKLTYTVKKEKADEILKNSDEEKRRAVTALVTEPFTPGKLFAALSDGEEAESAQALFDALIDAAEAAVCGEFGEGYWCDHWDYNLDLIEEYLSVFPEKEEEMLFEKAYTFFLPQIRINRRTKRYVATGKGVRQYRALDESSKRDGADKLVRANGGRGEVIRTTLMEKLLVLCAAKYAALDAYGMGVEMEGGKPGWYDALNGLPGLLGSSMAETCELFRMLDYTIGALRRYSRSVSVQRELAVFIDALAQITEDEAKNIAGEQELLSFWNRINDAKESYRDRVYNGMSGETAEYSAAALVPVLEAWRNTVSAGIDKALSYSGEDGICPTYFSYEVTRYEETGEGVVPLAFAVQRIPSFLEGPVRYLKLPVELSKKRELYRRVKDSDLYDRKLSMYKVNASLEEASYELGRARAFTPGWLENESVWLHMEYKYLLELLKSGLYEEYAADFEKVLIPFLDEEVYGRSVLENSSFIAGSKNPNPKIHGKGFVARLSGSTVEFLNMWKLMMFGKKLFEFQENELTFRPQPVLLARLVGDKRCVSAMLLGKTRVTYRLSECGDYFPGEYGITGMELTYRDGTKREVSSDMLRGQMAEDVRNHLVEAIQVNLKK